MRHPSPKDFSKQHILEDIDAISSLPSAESLDEDPETREFLANMDQETMVILPTDPNQIQLDGADNTDPTNLNSTSEPLKKRKAA